MVVVAAKETTGHKVKKLKSFNAQWRIAQRLSLFPELLSLLLLLYFYFIFIFSFFFD